MDELSYFYAYTFLSMVFFHFLFDYPLQGDFLSKAKNHLDSIPTVPWYQALFAHAFLQAGGVFYATMSFTLAGLELIAHIVIDYAKCSKKISYNVDQALHIGCKIVWMLILVSMSGVIP